MICLGIESSCDETALALVKDGQLLGSVLATQVELHALFGGVVPELASREHYKLIGKLFDKLIQDTGVKIADIDYYAVSRGPGLLGALLVGVGFAKGLAFATQKPIIGIHHLHAHLLAAGLEQKLNFPALGVLVSGGHTHIYRINSERDFIVLGRTLDDAAGEAFDKVGKIMGLPYPAGRLLDNFAKQGISNPKLFPRPYLDNDNLDFSFSGLKTSASSYVTQHKDELFQNSACDNKNIIPSKELCNMCASFNSAIVDTISCKVKRALDKEKDVTTLILAGGVAANSLLRENMQELMSERAGQCIIPSLNLCTDNASMVAYAGYLYAEQGFSHELNFEAIPRGRSMPEDIFFTG